MVEQHYHQQRGYTEADWLGTQGDPVLDVREIGYVIDTGEHVIGDGSTAFSGLIRYGGIGRRLQVEDVGTATYTVTANDTGKVKRFTVDCTVDLPTGLPVGTVVELMAFSAGGTTVQAGTGATTHNGGAVAQYDTVSCLVVTTDTWVVTGVTA